jgi:hypothetical protein
MPLIRVAGRVTPTAKRSSEGDVILPLEHAPVWHLGFIRTPGGSGVALILGLSNRNTGENARLGVSNDCKLYIKSVSWSTVKIG